MKVIGTFTTQKSLTKLINDNNLFSGDIFNIKHVVFNKTPYALVKDGSSYYVAAVDNLKQPL